MSQRRDTIRHFTIALGMFLIGIPFFFLIANWIWTAYTDSIVAELAFLALVISWFIASSLCTRSAKAVYWCIQFLLWTITIALFIIAAASTSYYGNSPLWFWLPLPLGLSILLAALYKKVLFFLAAIPFLQPSASSETPSYRQGYRAAQPKAAYAEGGQYHSYIEHEQPQAQYPQHMTQQQ